MANEATETIQQRSLDTQQTLLEATMDCINEFGYNGASTNKIIEKAGVSRGALLHHYPTKVELISATFAYLHEQVAAKVGEIVQQAEKNKQAWPEILLKIKESTFKGPLWDVFLEIMVASRTDETLYQMLIPTTNLYYNSVDTVWHQHFTTDQLTSAQIERITNILNLSMSVLRGLAVLRLLHDEQNYHDKAMTLWLEVLSTYEI